MSTSLPLVSLIIPAYNHERFVKECLDSASAQLYSNLELLIIDDGSTDRTPKIIEDWLANVPKRWLRLDYIKQENKGLTATLNSALLWAKGKYISPIASDDIMCPNKISVLVESLELKGEEYAAAFGNAQFINEQGSYINFDVKDNNGNVLGSHQLFLNYYLYGRDFNVNNPEDFGSYGSLLAGNYLPAMSTIVRTESIRKVGGWTSGNCVEDWELWLKLAKEYRFAYVDQIVALYRLHGSNATTLKREQILRDSIWLLENEKDYALKKNLHRYFFPAYQFNLKLLKEFDPKRSLSKRFRVSGDLEFYKYFLMRIKNKLYG